MVTFELPDGRFLEGRWADGELRGGDSEVLAAARTASDEGLEVWVSWHARAKADLSTLLGAAAALVAYSPGDAEIAHPVPEELIPYLRGEAEASDSYRPETEDTTIEEGAA